MIEFDDLAAIAKQEFADIVVSTVVIDAKLRIILVDNSYIDFWWSQVLPGRYAHHWERRHLDGSIYRHDNAPHPQWQAVLTYPKHFHDGSDANISESNLGGTPESALREFLDFARRMLARSG